MYSCIFPQPDKKVTIVCHAIKALIIQIPEPKTYIFFVINHHFKLIAIMFFRIRKRCSG